MAWVKRNGWLLWIAAVTAAAAVTMFGLTESLFPPSHSHAPTTSPAVLSSTEHVVMHAQVWHLPPATTKGPRAV